MALFMASALAAESTDRHRRSPAASGQQHSANYRVSKTRSRQRPVPSASHAPRKETASIRRDPRQAEREKHVTRATSFYHQRDVRQDRGRDRIAVRVRQHSDTDRRARHSGLRFVFNNWFDNYRYRVNRYIPLTYRGLNYFYNNGAYYRYDGFGLTLVSNHIGFFIYNLPFGYRPLWVGGYPYYYVHNRYYIRDRIREVYVQVDDPYQSRSWDEDDNDTPAYHELIVYPKLGQTEDQMKQDQYECYLWAVDQTGIDPSLAKPRDNQEYQRAKSACLEGRGYVVN